MSDMNDEYENIILNPTTSDAHLPHIDTLYSLFTKEFNKSYSESKKSIFAETLSTVVAHNAKNLSWKMGINKFSDLTWNEFKEATLMIPQNCSATGTFKFTNSTIPCQFDWRDQGVVTPVKNQLRCGSCWTFSTTGCLEAHWNIYKKKTFDLSEQQLIDCAGDFDNHGCNGGLPSHAFEYIRLRGGLQSESTYPYEAVTNFCRSNSKWSVAFVNGGSVNITAGNEDELTEAIANKGPVSIAFEVVGDFRNYKSGVYKSTECKNGPDDVNHAVLAVGYGVENGEKYYIVKNSWSATWGDQGYFKISRGVNMCGVAQCNSYPLLDKAEVTAENI